MGQTVPAEYFVELYRRERDPWNFEHSEYERRKYQATLEALPPKAYNNALELACSVGVFTSMLAQRCRRLLAVDVSEDALSRARRLNARHPHVDFRRRTLPAEYPAGAYDLTTVCEVGFYFGVHDLMTLRENVGQHTVHGGTIVLVHWTPPVGGHATTTAQVHETFRRSRALRWVNGFSRETYRFDVFERR